MKRPINPCYKCKEDCVDWCDLRKQHEIEKAAWTKAVNAQRDFEKGYGAKKDYEVMR